MAGRDETKKSVHLALFAHRELPPRVKYENSTECSPFWGTVSPSVAHKMFEKQHGMLAFFIVFSSI